MADPSATGPTGSTEPPDVAGRFELAYPGPLRDRLVAGVLDRSKTSTSSLLAEYQGEDDPLPEEGRRYLLVDSAERPVGVVETTEVRLVPLGEVDLPFAREEGEGYESVVEWREAHERFWTENAPGVPLEDSTVVVAERFRLVERLPAPAAGGPVPGDSAPAGPDRRGSA